jgi:hypothetical protein
MLRLTLAAALLLAAVPAFAQGYYAPNNQSIYGGGSGGYHWRNTAPPEAPYQGYTPSRPSGMSDYRPTTVCSTYGNQTYCN